MVQELEESVSQWARFCTVQQRLSDTHSEQQTKQTIYKQPSYLLTFVVQPTVDQAELE